MPLAIPVANPGTNGSNMRYWVGPGSGLTRGERGWTDGVYWYDDDGRSLDRPDSPIDGLPVANESERYDPYTGRGRVTTPPPAAPPAAAPPAAAPAQAAPVPPSGRVPDSSNPGAIQYALMRLAQLRALGYDFDIVDNDPTATWRRASMGVAEEARRLGYENPRDWLAGRPRPRPRPPAGFYDEGDTVAPPASTPRAAAQRSRASGAKKVVKKPAVRSNASAAKKVVKRPAPAKVRRPPRGAR